MSDKAVVPDKLRVVKNPDYMSTFATGIGFAGPTPDGSVVMHIYNETSEMMQVSLNVIDDSNPREVIVEPQMKSSDIELVRQLNATVVIPRDRFSRVVVALLNQAHAMGIPIPAVDTNE